ncbi:MAG: BsuBI/PstI family type II restriction endonuclease [Rhodobacteraceae bacterium]|nr:BsuBI/PstI family type II restriction endonuclease [Paracoccaceae bacterium]MCY4139062.1 BsuBI/PstI family type II restriction endonuclease [Paracoccaceae bacterium]
MTIALPPYVTRELVEERLPLVFPEGIPNRNWCVRQLAASTVFAMLYIGAVKDTGRYLGPIHVYRMTDEQAGMRDDKSRLQYGENVRKRNYLVPGERWYADNTREPIRDETLREGLVNIGAVFAREDLPTTSSNPRYALERDFAALFDPSMSGTALTTAISEFQTLHLSASTLARVALIRAGAVARETGVMVKFPNGETRRLAPGPSSVISKAVVETFAPNFLRNPAVLWLSESGNKVVSRDDSLAGAIGLEIEADKDLPDLILVDLGPTDTLIVFVEVVATDGPMSSRRQEALYRLTDVAGFDRAQVAFVTAYRDRSARGFRRTVSALAWGSFVWFASEPQNIVHLRDGRRKAPYLSECI